MGFGLQQSLLLGSCTLQSPLPLTTANHTPIWDVRISQQGHVGTWDPLWKHGVVPQNPEQLAMLNINKEDAFHRHSLEQHALTPRPRFCAEHTGAE